MSGYGAESGDRYHNQIRRIQAALRGPSGEEGGPPTSSHDGAPRWPVQRGEGGRSADALPHRPQPLPASANSSGCRVLGERHVNEQAKPEVASKRVIPASPSTGVRRDAYNGPTASAASSPSLFASAVASTTVFDDLVARAWGCYGETGDVRSRDAPAVAEDSHASNVGAALSLSGTPFASASVASTAAHGHLCTTPYRVAASTTARATRSVTPTVAAYPSAAPCNAETASAVSQVSSFDSGFGCLARTPSASATATSANQRGATRIASSVHFDSAAATTQPVSASARVSLARARQRGSGGHQGIQPPVPQQQRLLARIQLLDRILESGCRDTGSAQVLRLLRMIKDDNNKPIFKAAPANWTAVRRLREELVRALLGKPPRGRGFMSAWPASRELSLSPSVVSHAASVMPTRDGPCVERGEMRMPALCECGEAVEDVEEVREESSPHGFSLPATPPPPALHGSTAIAALSQAVAPLPPTVEAVGRGTSESVDDYAASTAAFQRESEAMHHAQERLLARRQASAGGTR
ncbi:hypothetical protein ABL78_5549 [Leptomonas seymouri]|uniref:Uncharacterized protein n=1 Tax=Leptomonas seymouri TaxID=5684 RepID=A0A0N1I4N4_LEPSE|nr:hypothetical protein ABL78_5549 [Leptomonas seymouri]|eukprot:KPI85401.1 hypothetical protein ABL78_5549 [Leptomonas seymouri]